ncbi:glycerophosphodiester phosphodiesterase [Aliiglaciecola sp. CAU 1673]|uniref:glycerophosphodiester phosphodiesterase n=1 Tax=Aliiglaciecola sp. CAU 1673 TaxID=3032595 RepID=UPI0023DA7CB3|nr:glycerophosphodiester phosphodiesterase [Aliiglaciecola sp. CAU 1673]MDF2179314.1 glycerophosphodiester phosphodiesterase [Aliiglaciecola sp. CAU 1673]
MRLILLLGALLGIPGVSAMDIIAHRGASGYLPEHTLESAILAHGQGADYIEQDLVLSKDNVPVVLHDIHLETVTDVEQRFPERARDDGRFYALDFTLAELKTLRVHERTDEKGVPVFPHRYQGNGLFRIATFEEQLTLIRELNRSRDKSVGFYPEIKSPKWHQQQGRDISAIVLAILRQHQLDDANAKIFVQCFDFAELKRWRQELGAKVKLVQLLGENDWQESDSDYDYLKSEQGLAEIASIAQGIGPWIEQLASFHQDGIELTGLMQRAKAKGLLVHPYTLRADQLPGQTSWAQMIQLLAEDLAVDGVFTDFSDKAKAAF